jgi:TRAP-type mannitol/chloroaromatic compound transport system substrate-binding protein
MTFQSRRQLIQGAGLAAATGALAAPAIAQDRPNVRWRMAASFPKTLDTCFGSTSDMCRRIGELTEGRFQITLHAPGELVPALEVMKAVSNGTVECGQAFSSFYFGTNPAFIFDAGLAFGLNPRQQNAWMYQAGGLELVRELYAKYDCYPIPIGNFGVQMGGWFRKEIKSLADLKGLRMRIGGFGGMVMSRMGVAPQQIAGGEIYTAMEKGTIDAAEFVGPYDDEKLGLNKVAPFYYAPGWWEGSAQMTALINMKAWQSLPKSYQIALEVAATEANMSMLSRYDAKNPAAIRSLLSKGTQLRWFPRDVMDAAYKNANELFEELADKNEDFKKIYVSWRKYRDEQASWYQVADHYLDTYTFNAMKRRT